MKTLKVHIPVFLLIQYNLLKQNYILRDDIVLYKKGAIVFDVGFLKKLLFG
jgi:hypothetical protein